MNTQFVGFGRRFVAGFLDGLIIMVVYVIITTLLGSVMKGAVALNYLFSFGISVGYYVFYQSSAGQTIGKKVLGIKVVDYQGNKPTMMTFFLREIIGKLVSGIILGIGYLMVLWDGKKQGLHDKIASTYVIKV